MTVIVIDFVLQPPIVPPQSLGLRREIFGNGEFGNEKIFMGISCCFFRKKHLLGYSLSVRKL